jgi:ribosome-associated toxin RatA of RatAB toxin-antitoxin module
MPEYQRSTTIEADPDELFQFLSTIENLPKYFTRLTEAHYATGDTVRVVAQLPPGTTDAADTTTAESNALFSIDADQRALTWSSENETAYRGALQVVPTGEGASIELTLHTHHEGASIEEGIDQTLENVRRLVAQRPPLQS